MDGAEQNVFLRRRDITHFWRRNRHHNFTFMSDGAPCHRARRTIRWLEDRRIPILDWPAYSSDINIIENVWGSMVHKIYEGNKSYVNVAQLKKAIVAA
uniref:DDE_3 domain-containing protein n=1 Tax=Caenorhabditis japonica TaxID=281687 RepID=A0A8R1EL28_CAEJA